MAIFHASLVALAPLVAISVIVVGCQRASPSASDAGVGAASSSASAGAAPSASAPASASAGAGGEAGASSSSGSVAATEPTAALDAGGKPPDPPVDPRPAFELSFEVHDVEKTKDGVRAKLRLKTKDKQVVEYKTAIAHVDCYVMAGKDSVDSLKVVEGDEAVLVCSGGERQDEALVRRTSDTSAEVIFSQKPTAPPGSTTLPPPINVQTASIKLPKGTKLMTSFERPVTSPFKK